MTEINWKYQIGDGIVTEDSKGKKLVDYVITGREIRTKKINSKKDRRGFQNVNLRYYEYKCNICGAEHLWKPENKVNTRKCACCAGVVRIKGINTIGDLFPECLPYIDEDDAFNPQLSWNDKYEAKCPVCGFRKNIFLSNLLKRKRIYCVQCNSFGNKKPDMVKYLVNKDDVSLLFSSNTEVLTLCPDCGAERNMRMRNLSFQGYSCVKCGDGISFSEKFTMNLLTQLGVDFIYQLSSKHVEWCDKYKYDFYVPNKNMVIEVHGVQHYEDSFSRCGGRTAKEEQKNDKAKEALARKNNISNYVILDCRHSGFEWIKNSILNSKINEIYDISAVDWTKCLEFALSSLVKRVCDYWNTHISITTKDVAKEFNLDESTIRKYLKTGSKLKWCNYNAKEESEKQKKPVFVFKDGECLGTFDSIADLTREFERKHNIKLLIPCVSRVCNGKLKKHKGFVFKFSETPVGG